MTTVRPSFPAIKTQPLSGDAASHPTPSAIRTALMSKTGSWSGDTPPVVDFPAGYTGSDWAILLVGYQIGDPVGHLSTFGSSVVNPSGWFDGGLSSPDFGFSQYSLVYKTFETKVLSKTSVTIPNTYQADSDSSVHDMGITNGTYMLLIIPDIDHWDGFSSENMQEGDYHSDLGPNSRSFDFVSAAAVGRRKLILSIGSSMVTVGNSPDVSTDALGGFIYNPAKFYAHYIIEGNSAHYNCTLTDCETGQAPYIGGATGAYFETVGTMQFTVLGDRRPIRVAAASTPGDVRVRRV